MPFRGSWSGVAACLIVAGVIGIGARPTSAQNQTRGFNLTVPPTIDSAELAQQQDPWVMEVSFKPMRMIRVEVTDPVTKQKKSQLVWYLVWRAVNRTLNTAVDESPFKPNNERDTVPRPFFVPEFDLVTDDNGVQKIYPDVVIPEAQAAIAARERMELKNSIEIVQVLPEATPEGETPKTVLEGVAMWSDVDPHTDYFTVYASGFASPYKITKGPDGKPLIWRKSIVQEFWRPSDAIDQRETEIRRLDELQPSAKAQHSPRWIYRADADVAPYPQDLPTAQEESTENAEDSPAPAADGQPEPKAEDKPAAEGEANPAPEAEANPAPEADAQPAEKAE